MKSTFTWIDGFRSEVCNGRGHKVIMDLPEAAGGTNQGPKAFEYLMMSLNGCIGTIFASVAAKMRIKFEEMKIDMEATEGPETIDAISYKFYIKTDAPLDKVEKCLETTERHCPVGMLFHKASVPFKHEIILL